MERTKWKYRTEQEKAVFYWLRMTRKSGKELRFSCADRDTAYFRRPTEWKDLRYFRGRRSIWQLLIS